MTLTTYTPAFNTFSGRPLGQPSGVRLLGAPKASHVLGQAIDSLRKTIATTERKTGEKLGLFSAERFKLFGLKARQAVSTHLLDYDFVGFHPYKIGGKDMTFSTPPAGALFLMAYLGLEGWRGLRAWQRRMVTDPTTGKEKPDYREMRDIAVRDTWSIAVYIYGLPIFNKLFLNAGQKWSGLKLGEGSHNWSYGDHEEHRTFRTLKNKQGRVVETAVDRYWTNMLEGSHHGIAKAAQHKTALGVPARLLRWAEKHHPQTLATLSELVPLREQLITRVKRDADIVAAFMNEPATQALQKQAGKLGDEPFRKAQWKAFEAFLDKHHPKQKNAILSDSMHTLDKMRSLQERVMKGIHATDATAGKRFAKLWRNLDGFAAHSAKNWLTWLSMASFGVVVLLIGLLPVWANLWITRREYEKHLARQQQDHITVPHTPPTPQPAIAAFA